jgi:hypothetical protein
MTWGANTQNKALIGRQIIARGKRPAASKQSAGEVLFRLAFDDGAEVGLVGFDDTTSVERASGSGRHSLVKARNE